MKKVFGGNPFSCFKKKFNRAFKGKNKYVILTDEYNEEH